LVIEVYLTFKHCVADVLWLNTNQPRFSAAGYIAKKNKPLSMDALAVAKSLDPLKKRAFTT